jgi:protein TonB
LTFGQDSDSIEIDEIIGVVEKPAAPVGGLDNYFKWINDNNKLKYSSDSLTHHDKVFVEFWVGKDRQITNVRTVTGIGEPYDQEAIRLITENPIPWQPAEQRGKKLASRWVLPVYFVDERPPKYTPDKIRKRKKY